MLEKLLEKLKYLSLQARQQYLEHKMQLLRYCCSGIPEDEPRREVSTYVIYSDWKLQFICKNESDPSQRESGRISFRYIEIAKWCALIGKLLSDITRSRRVTTTDMETQSVPQRVICSLCFTVGSAVLITMLCNSMSLFLLKAQTWVETAHHRLHRWHSTASTAPTAQLT